MPQPSSNPHGLGIDHLLLVVASLERAAADMDRLGFTVTPRGLHSTHLGTANHTIVFQQDYLELIGVVTPTPHNQLHRDNLRRGQGCHTAAITTDSIAGTRAALAGSGIPTDEPISFSRPVELPDRTAQAAFEVVRPARAALSNGFMFFCNHRTPETVWVPEWTRHANTARRIAAIVIESSDPSEAAAAYRPLFADGHREELSGGVRLATGKACIEFLTPDRINELYGRAGVGGAGSPFFKVARIGVDDVAAARSVMERNAVPFVLSQAGSVLVRPTEACGAVLEFAAEK